MKLRRRGFLGALGAGAMGLVLPYEPKRIYSFPARRIIRLGPVRERVHRPFRDSLLDQLEPTQLILPAHVFAAARLEGRLFRESLGELGIDKVTR